MLRRLLYLYYVLRVAYGDLGTENILLNRTGVIKISIRVVNFIYISANRPIANTRQSIL